MQAKAASVAILYAHSQLVATRWQVKLWHSNIHGADIDRIYILKTEIFLINICDRDIYFMDKNNLKLGLAYYIFINNHKGFYSFTINVITNLIAM